MTTNYTKENPPKVTRNEVGIVLAPQKFGKTSPNKGQEFWSPEVNSANQSGMLKFIGDNIVNATLTRMLRRVGIEISTAPKNKNEDGSFNWESALEDWASFDTGGATLSDLNEDISLLQDQAAEVTDQMEEGSAAVGNEGEVGYIPAYGPCYDDNGEVIPAMQERFNELSSQLKDLTTKIRPLKKEIKRIQEKYQVIAEKRAATKEEKAGQKKA